MSISVPDYIKILESGTGPVFADPDPDMARAFFRTKSRKLTSKLMSLEDAVSRFVHDGDYLVVGGFGANRTPIAAVHEIVRQSRKKMTLAGHTSTHDMQVLVAGGVIERVDIAYVIGLEARGLSMQSRKLFESGKLQISEDTNHGLASRFKAAAMGIPFIPIRSSIGTDTFKYGCGKVIECPFTGKKVVIKPAIFPDISIIHVHEADIYGNAHFKGIVVSDLDVANSTKRLIITAERLIDTEDFRNDPSSTMIPNYLVDAVCEVPYGAYPGNMPYEYFSDEKHLEEWLQVEKCPEKFQDFLEYNIYSCKDNDEYIEKHGGIRRMQYLRQIEYMIDKEDG